MRFVIKSLFVFLILCLSVSLMAEESPLASKKFQQALVDEVSGEIAFNYTVLISHFDRVQASEGWHDSALMIKKELEKIGYADAAIEGWPSNGSRYYYTYQTPIGWRANKAELWIVSPARERLCSFEEIPLTLVKHSNSADVEAELIDVGSGVGEKSYEGKDVKGKIVLATEYTGNVMREAVVKRGALGVVTCTPDSLPSYLNDVVVNFTKFAERLRLQSMNGITHPFAYRVQPFGGGSDHYIFNDGALRVPAVMFGHGDTFHHTSLDTPEKVDASELRRVCFIALGSMYYMANASEAEAREMARLICRNGLARLSADYYDTLALMCKASPAELHDIHKQLLNVIEHSTRRETQSILATSVFSKNPQYKKDIAHVTGSIKTLESTFRADAEKAYKDLCREKSLKPLTISMTEEEENFRNIVPVRAEDFVCPLQESYVTEKLGPDALNAVRLPRYAAYEALNYVDGHRSLFDICKAVSAEYGPIDPKMIHSFFRVLERSELVQIHEK